MQVLKVSNDSLLAPKLIENFTPNIKRHFAFSTIQSHTVQDTVWLIQTLFQVLMLFVDLRLLIRIDLEKVHWLNRRCSGMRKQGCIKRFFQPVQWRIQGGRPRRPPDQNFLNFMQFLGKSGKFVCWRPPGVGAPSYGESCIRPCHLRNYFETV